MSRTAEQPCLITVEDAATLLSVSPRTVLGWIEADALTYVEYREPPKQPSYRVPLHGLIRALPQLYDLATEFREADDIVAFPLAVAETPLLYEAMASVAVTTGHVAGRLVDRLAHTDLVERRVGADARAVPARLKPQARRVTRRVHAASEAAIEHAPPAGAVGDRARALQEYLS